MPAKYVIPLSSKAVNEVVVPRVSVKGIMTELAHVKPVPKFPYALQQKPIPLSKNFTAGCQTASTQPNSKLMENQIQSGRKNQ